MHVSFRTFAEACYVALPDGCVAALPLLAPG